MFCKKSDIFILDIIQMKKISTRSLLDLILNSPNKLFEVKLFVTNFLTLFILFNHRHDFIY